MIVLFFLWEIVFTLASLILMRIDKVRAVKKLDRIPEKVLLFFGLIGPVGMLLAMSLRFASGRHKNRKWYFWAVTLVALVMHIIFFIMLVTA